MKLARVSIRDRPATAAWLIASTGVMPRRGIFVLQGGCVRLLIVALGAGLGGVSRYLLQGWILERTGPSILALFVINVSGSFALGLVTTLAVERNLINPDIRLLLTTGFLGGYTTFSSWMLESFQLLEVGNIMRASVNVLGSAIIGLVGVYLGIVAGRIA